MTNFTDTLTPEGLARRAREMLAARDEPPRSYLPPPGICRATRESSGLSQEMVGELIGTTAATISRWEQGENAPTEPLRSRYAVALRMMSELAMERGWALSKQRDAEMRARWAEQNGGDS